MTTSFVHEYVDNETQLPRAHSFNVGASGGGNEGLLLPVETHDSLPAGARDKLPFGMNIKKAAYQLAPIDEKTRQVLEQYQDRPSNRGKEAEEILDDILNEELSSSDSVSCSSSDDDINLKMDLEPEPFRQESSTGK